MTVLDASAVLALVHDEPGADEVAESLDGALLCSANLAEVVGTLTESDGDSRRLVQLLVGAGVVLEPLTAADGARAGALRQIEGGRSLSLGDRCCLALTLRSRPAEVLTTDPTWADLDLPVTVRLLR